VFGDSGLYVAGLRIHVALMEDFTPAYIATASNWQICLA
jgi:hypothetical protein